jgi:hypothetical protein
MKKFPQRQKNRQSYAIIIILVSVLLLSGIGFGFYHYENTRSLKSVPKTTAVKPINTINYAPSNPQDNTLNSTRKSSSSPATTLDNGSTTTQNSTLSAQIVNATTSGSNIHIGTMIGGTTSGTCTITATQGQTTVTLDTVSVEQDVNSYDCGGGAINVSTSQLNPDSGTWQLTLTVSSGGSQATNTTSITL